MGIFGQLSKQASSGAGSAGKWIKLKNDGDAVVFVPVGAPVLFEKDFPAGQYGEATRKTVGAVNAWLPDTKETKVIELGRTHFSDLCEVIEEGGVNAMYRMKRKGAAGDTKTRYVVTKMRDLTADEIAEAGAATLHVLDPNALPF